MKLSSQLLALHERNPFVRVEKLQTYVDKDGMLKTKHGNHSSLNSLEQQAVNKSNLKTRSGKIASNPISSSPTSSTCKKKNIKPLSKRLNLSKTVLSSTNSHGESQSCCICSSRICSESNLKLLAYFETQLPSIIKTLTGVFDKCKSKSSIQFPEISPSRFPLCQICFSTIHQLWGLEQQFVLIQDQINGIVSRILGAIWLSSSIHKKKNSEIYSDPPHHPSSSLSNAKKQYQLQKKREIEIRFKQATIPVYEKNHLTETPATKPQTAKRSSGRPLPKLLSNSCNTSVLKKSRNLSILKNNNIVQLHNKEELGTDLTRRKQGGYRSPKKSSTLVSDTRSQELETATTVDPVVVKTEAHEEDDDFDVSYEDDYNGIDDSSADIDNNIKISEEYNNAKSSSSPTIRLSLPNFDDEDNENLNETKSPEDNNEIPIRKPRKSAETAKQLLKFSLQTNSNNTNTKEAFHELMENDDDSKDIDYPASDSSDADDDDEDFSISKMPKSHTISKSTKSERSSTELGTEHEESNGKRRRAGTGVMTCKRKVGRPAKHREKKITRPVRDPSQPTVETLRILKYNEASELELAGFKASKIELLWKCHECGHFFPSQGRVRLHIRSAHIVVTCNCSHCGKTFDSKSDLLRHTSEEHTGERLYSCPSCPKTYNNRGSLHWHTTWVHLRQTKRGPRSFLTCKVCDKRFINNGKLTNHMRTHTGERPFICEICSHSCSTSAVLTAHKKRMHSGKPPREIVLKKKRKNLHTCNICSFVASSKSSYEIHLRRHTSERPFECDICGHRTTQMACLNRHKKLKHTTDESLMNPITAVLVKKPELKKWVPPRGRVAPQVVDSVFKAVVDTVSVDNEIDASAKPNSEIQDSSSVTTTDIINSNLPLEINENQCIANFEVVRHEHHSSGDFATNPLQSQSNGQTLRNSSNDTQHNFFSLITNESEVSPHQDVVNSETSQFLYQNSFLQR